MGNFILKFCGQKSFSNGFTCRTMQANEYNRSNFNIFFQSPFIEVLGEGYSMEHQRIKCLVLTVNCGTEDNYLPSIGVTIIVTNFIQLSQDFFKGNRITHILADTIFFIKDLMTAHKLAPTLESTRFLEDRRQKSRNVDQGLLNTPARTGSEWKEANYLLRSCTLEWQPTDYSAGYAQPRDFTAPTKDANAPFEEDCATCITLEGTRRTLTLSYNADDI